MTFYQFMADVVVVVHAAYVGFVLFGLVAVLLGRVLRWSWVRNFWFRAAHLLTIGIVVVQALLGVLCPLTILENYLRAKGGESTYPGSFIGHWIHELLFFDMPAEDFTLIYCLFGAIVVATLVLSPPRWPWGRGESKSEAPPVCDE